MPDFSVAIYQISYVKSLILKSQPENHHNNTYTMSKIPSDTTSHSPLNEQLLLFIGTCCWDIIMDVPVLPMEDTEVRATAMRACKGGNASNSATVAARYAAAMGLGVQAAWVGVLGSAEHCTHTQAVLREFAAAGVQVCGQHTSGQCPTSVIQSVAARGTRTITHFRGIPELDAPGFAGIAAQYNFAGRAAACHAEARAAPATTQWLTTVRAWGIPVTVELEKIRGSSTPGAANPEAPAAEHTEWHVAALADGIFTSSEFFHGLGIHEFHAEHLRVLLDGIVQARAEVAADAALASLLPPHVHVCVSLGAQGALSATLAMADQAITHVVMHAPPEFKPGEAVVDTVGAGDTLIGVAAMHFSTARSITPSRHHTARWESAIAAGVAAASAKVARVGLYTFDFT